MFSNYLNSILPFGNTRATNLYYPIFFAKLRLMWIMGATNCKVLSYSNIMLNGLLIWLSNSNTVKLVYKLKFCLCTKNVTNKHKLETVLMLNGVTEWHSREILYIFHPSNNSSLSFILPPTKKLLYLLLLCHLNKKKWLYPPPGIIFEIKANTL